MIKERLITLFNKERTTGWFEKQTGIDRYRWQNIKAGKARLSDAEIEAVAKLFPQYRWWLMTGQVMPEIGQTSPPYDEALSNLDSSLSKSKGTYRIVDVVDARWMEKSIVKPSRLSQLIFLITEDDHWRTAALFLVGSEEEQHSEYLHSGRPVVLIGTGNMSFLSTGGGRVVARDFRRWITSHDKDLIERAEIHQIEASILEKGNYSKLNIPVESLKPVSHDLQVYERFRNWVDGTSEYVIEGLDDNNG